MASRVVRYQADRTNQKLYFAKLACRQIAQVEGNVQLVQAQRETAVFHLYGAYQAFLQEIMRFYGVALPYPTAADIKVRLADKGQVSPEITELETYLKSGFLAELQRAFLSCQYAPIPAQPLSEDSNSDTSNLIIKVTQSPQSWLPDETLLLEWRQTLMQLIERLRGGMQEY